MCSSSRHRPRSPLQNFLGYANRGDWDNSFFHRSIPGFVLQGGGYSVKNNNLSVIPQQPAVKNEPHPGAPGNVLGTIAMAKLSGQPDSATNQWFFNLGDNRTAPNDMGLDQQNGGFTAFGKVANAKSLAVLQKLASAGVYDASGQFGATFTDLPVTDLTGLQNRIKADPNAGLQVSDLVGIYRVALEMAVGKVK